MRESHKPIDERPVDRDSFEHTPGIHVRYLGFDGIPAGRRLKFRVRGPHTTPIEVTFDIPDAWLKGGGISVQDAAPMAYQKLRDVLASDGAVSSTEWSLTPADIAGYRASHTRSKRGQEAA